MYGKVRILLAPAVMLLLVAIVVLRPQNAATVESAVPGNHVLAHALDIELGHTARRPHEQMVSSGPLFATLQASGELDRRADRSTGSGRQPQADTAGCQNEFAGGQGEAGPNIRVNQDCSFRRQAEEVIAINPTNPNNLIAGQNDSRIGFNHCGYDFSFDGGDTWGDQVPPFYQYLLRDGHTADACSDPTATFDADGNAYVGGVLFDINSAASAFVVMKSNAPIGGAFYHSPKALSFQTSRDTPVGEVASDNDPNVFHDKEFIVADAHAQSAKKNNVYATWTLFKGATGAGVGANSSIYFSQSTDGGATWSPGIEISGANAAICTAFSGEANPNACDQDQGSHPVVGPDGKVYVAFGNGNTPTLGLNQHLVVSCPVTQDCSNPASWTAPVKISDDIGAQPMGPDPATACSAGRQCLPPNGYRLDDFVEGSLSVDNAGELFFAWADFRNGVGGPCDWNNAAAGQAALATPPCDNDVFYAFSTNGGATWSTPINVTPASKLGPSAQWQPWSAVAPNGKNLFIGYYDRHYGNCEVTGCNDVSLATVAKPASTSPKISYKRVTTSSMPNLVPANNPIEAGFLGDYMWVAADAKGQPYIIWADTRGQQKTVEEDIYLAKPEE